MITPTKASNVDGRTICGETFLPADGDSAHAVYTRGDRCCGITYEMGSAHSYLRCTPGYQLPPFARDKSAWGRFAWLCDDDRMSELRMDESDGELIYHYSEADLDEDVEAAVRSCLDFLLGDQFHDDLCTYVRMQWQK